MYLDESGQVTYIVVNPGGAYFGEDYEFSIDVRPGASLLLSTQSATRIHRTPERPAVQTMSIQLRDGARFEYIPDQLIAYRDASYEQWTDLTVAPTAQAFMAEIVTPGWDPHGIPLTYVDIRLRTEIRESVNHRLVAVDNIRMRPEDFGQSLEAMGYLEGYSHMGSVVVVGEHATDAYADEIRSALEPHDVRAGVTRGERHGVAWIVVRALSFSTDVLAAMIERLNGMDRAATTGQAAFNLRRY
jgi:urease accessory protein